MTYAENEGHKELHGTKLVGSQRPASKLNENDVRLIRELRDEGYKLLELAEMFNVTETCISYVCKRRTWKYVE